MIEYGERALLPVCFLISPVLGAVTSLRSTVKTVAPAATVSRLTNHCASITNKHDLLGSVEHLPCRIDCFTCKLLKYNNLGQVCRGAVN